MCDDLPSYTYSPLHSALRNSCTGRTAIRSTRLGAGLKAHADMTLGLPLLGESPQRAHVPGRDDFLGLHRDPRVVAEDEVHLEPRGRVLSRLPGPEQKVRLLADQPRQGPPLQPYERMARQAVAW